MKQLADDFVEPKRAKRFRILDKMVDWCSIESRYDLFPQGSVA